MELTHTQHRGSLFSYLALHTDRHHTTIVSGVDQCVGRRINNNVKSNFSLKVIHVLALINSSHNKTNKCTNVKIIFFTHNLS